MPSSSSSISDIRNTLRNLDTQDMIQLCLRMAKYKKENKELLAYLLYDSQDEARYIESVVSEMDMLFDGLTDNGSYKLMKQIRKIGRIIGKPIKYSGLPATQVELLIHYCKRLKPWLRKKPNLSALQNLYTQQLKKIDKALDKLHEDLQFDYHKDMESLRF